jgi:Pyruvate/2-oxoacid:ferredoxin oxidoreductase gamma subunit
MVMVGAFIAATQILSIDSVFAALNEITPPHKNDLLETNRDLIRKGYRLCEDKKG